jgi:hypothetical protein
MQDAREEGALIELMLRSDMGETAYVVCSLHPVQSFVDCGIYGGIDVRSGRQLKIYVGNDEEPTIVHVAPAKAGV